MLFNAIFILVLGLVTSYTDIIEGKIRNKHLLGIFFSFCIFLGLTFLGGYSLSLISYHFLKFLFAFLLGFLIWLFDIWSEGDAKLFAVLAFLLPQQDAHIFSQIKILLLATFLPLTFYILASTFPKQIKKIKITKSKFFFELKEIVLTVFGIYWALHLLLGSLQNIYYFSYNPIILILLTFLVRYLIKKSLRKMKANRNAYDYLVLGLCVFRIIYETEKITTIKFISDFLKLILIYSIIKFILFEYSETLSEKIRIKNLKPGMRSAETVFRKKGNALRISSKQDLENISNTDKIIIADNQKITPELMTQLKNLKVKELNVKHTLPFAPFLFSGTIITLIFLYLKWI